MSFNQLLLILHFVGLAMGLSASFSNMVMGKLIARATPPDQAVLRRFPPAMTRVGHIGLALLWITGVTMLFTKYFGLSEAFSLLPKTFHVKLTAVVVLTACVGYISVLMRKARQGDAAAMALIPKIGGLAFVATLTAIVFAVLTFDL